MESIIELPNGIQANLQGDTLSIKGPQGELKRRLHPSVSVHSEGKQITFESPSKAMLNTFVAHARNMVRGAEKGYVIRMKIVYAHFPVTVETKGTQIIIKNFLGEKLPRYAKLFGPTKIEAKGQEASLKGPDKEAIGLTFASLRRATRIGNKDPRVFQDGFYVVERT